MYLSDSSGNAVCIKDTKIHNQFNLINPQKVLRIKRSDAEKNRFANLVYKKDSQLVFISMNTLILDSIVDNGDYVYGLEL
jgi:hypothetical protein